MKNKFIKTTLILIIGSLITKVLSMIIKIIITRSIPTETLGLYMMLTPTLLLVVNITNSGLPIAISKLIAEDTRNNKKLLLSLLPIQIIIDVIMMIVLFIIAPYLSTNLLKNKDLYLGIISISLIIPFTSISSIIRGYFFGKSNALPITLSNIVELLTKLTIYYTFLPLIKLKDDSYIICFLILTTVVTEIISIIIMMLFLPRNIDVNKKDLLPRLDYIKDTLSISIPNTTSKLIGSIGYFLEPIILISTLKYVGYSTKYITYQYGIISGYVIPLLILPSFITTSISQALLPNITKEYTKGNIKGVKRKLRIAITLSIFIGFISTFIFISIPNLLLRFIYHTDKGIKYIRVLAPIIFIEYINTPLSTTLESIGKSKINMLGSIIGTLIRVLSLFILSLCRIGLWSLIISISLNTIVTTTYYIIKINNYL